MPNYALREGFASAPAAVLAALLTVVDPLEEIAPRGGIRNRSPIPCRILLRSRSALIIAATGPARFSDGGALGHLHRLSTAVLTHSSSHAISSASTE